MTRNWCLTLVATAAIGAVTQVLAGQQFRTEVNVAFVDVTVVDAQGSPITGLGTADFSVSVEGKRAQILSVEYLPLTSPAKALAAAPASGRSNSGSVTRQRNVLILVDDLSFKLQPAPILSFGLERTLAAFDERDLIGIATTSGLGPSVVPTRDRDAVRAVLSKLQGRFEDAASPFMIGVDEALGFQNAAGRNPLGDAIKRECSIVNLGPSCAEAVTSAARRQAAAALERLDGQMQMLQSTIAWMRQLPEPRVLLLLSSGIASTYEHRYTDQMRAIQDAAAGASVQMYALTRIEDASDAADRTPERARARMTEGRFLGNGARAVAAAAGGEPFAVVGQADAFFKRIVAETSGVYRLSVELSARPKGRTLVNVMVDVPRKGVTVRVRPRAMASPPML